MGRPIAPATLSPDQLRDLNLKLSHMRHEVNNQLSLMMAAMEMIRFRPEARDRMLESLAQRPAKIQEEVARFSAEFAVALGLGGDEV